VVIFIGGKNAGKICNMENYRILVTPLYRSSSFAKTKYYYVEDDDNKVYYCEALLSAEASVKYALANLQIDEIVTFGTKSTYDPGDEIKTIVLNEGRNFYASDIGSLSTYSLFRYRLAEYLDELNAELQDLRSLLDAKEQEEVLDFLDEFFRTDKHNRHFDLLNRNDREKEAFFKHLKDSIPGAKKDFVRYRSWILQYLYSQMGPSFKMKLASGNEDVKICFLPAKSADDYSSSFIKTLASILEANPDRNIDICMCMQSEDAGDTFVLLNMMDIVKALPNSRVSVSSVISTTRTPDATANKIQDESRNYLMTDLLAGIRSFLSYGKTDILMQFRERLEKNDHHFDQILFPMRDIDIGISLCDISEIERGIDGLRKAFAQLHPDYNNQADLRSGFRLVLLEGIKEDYGPLITGETVHFIDMVKWAYRKGFWQQTLTLIESRCPGDLVDRGIFYYANSDETAHRARNFFINRYRKLLPFEKYKLEDLSHYFIKVLGRGRVPRDVPREERQKYYAHMRVADLTETAKFDFLPAFTLCDDKQALENLLLSYYLISEIRNKTNHAAESQGSERLTWIQEGVDFFIKSYDRVAQLIEGKQPDVVKVDPEVVASIGRKPRRHHHHQPENNETAR